MPDSVLIANRGAISCRITRTLHRLGLRSVAVYSRADLGSLHVSAADVAVCIGESAPADTYLNQARLLEVARDQHCVAIHPGYGFLSENAEFAQRCVDAGIAFIGPEPRHIRAFGLKHTARELALDSGLPLLPGTALLEAAAQALQQADRIGYPVMLKSTAGGGGIGMQLCHTAAELAAAFESVSRLSRNNFGNAGVYIEKFIAHARHIEVQVFGDGRGQVIALGERDCSLQRRNQKVVEETPAPGLAAPTRARMFECATRLCAATGYRSAGTVEYIYDPATHDFYFLEVNTRLQVEHGVTEEVNGIDLVEWMVRLAAGDASPMQAFQHAPHGAALQVRLYAEDPARSFQPCAGTITRFIPPPDARCDTWVETGTEIPPFYDPMIAKIIVHGESRAAALAKLARQLAEMRCDGIETNLQYLRELIADPIFVTAQHHTRFLDTRDHTAATIEVLEAGTQSTVQDYPGRRGFWAVGVPPSGPMDNLAFRLGNHLLANRADAAGLELTLTGPTLQFNVETVIALTGATMDAQLDGVPVAWWQAVAVRRGAVLQLGRIAGGGARSYLCVRHGFDVPPYLGSRSTFTLGQFGGHAGRALRAGDVLHVQRAVPAENLPALRAEQIPQYAAHWSIRVTCGPHGAPDFFTDQDMATFFATDWEVHYNSSRTGVRLLGPKPQWARADGGEAGLHPSNIHDNAYAVGSIDYTGDMPVILGPDGPSLGGFVCPATVITADLWMIGQLKPGDRIRFIPIGIATARTLAIADVDVLESLNRLRIRAPVAVQPDSPVLRTIGAAMAQDALCFRVDGDDNLLVEFGPMALDLTLRFRGHALMQALAQQALPGIINITPGIRSLQLNFDPRHWSHHRLVDLLAQIDADLPPLDDMEVPSRIVHLPLCWDDPATRLAIEKYMQLVRADAPWCPGNIEFIRRINGLADEDAVRHIVYEAQYMVLGLGDVYLGAPVATPIDPRHRLVTTKYNPARTWTPENAVGIGGAYLCIYGMEGPGGYQFVGRTLQMWNRHRITHDFPAGRPWLLQFFDRIRFFPVSNAELTTLREEFPLGRYRIKIEDAVFRPHDYQGFLADNAPAIARFKDRQRTAFAAERQRWSDAGQRVELAPAEPAPADDGAMAPGPGQAMVSAHVPGCIWKLLVREGDRVAAGAVLAIIESMKMEMQVIARNAGMVHRVLCREGGAVSAGQHLLILNLQDT